MERRTAIASAAGAALVGATLVLAIGSTVGLFGFDPTSGVGTFQPEPSDAATGETPSPAPTRTVIVDVTDTAGPGAPATVVTRSPEPGETDEPDETESPEPGETDEPDETESPEPGESEHPDEHESSEPPDDDTDDD